MKMKNMMKSTIVAALCGIALASAPAIAVQPAAAAAQPAAVAKPAFSFNRLLRAPVKPNLPPTEDGIHDPANEETQLLQPPLQGMADFERSNFGNSTNWVATLGSKRISPRWDRADPTAEGFAMDLNILRVAKGSMPNVVFPHKQHTEWLDCSNCHPAIFVPQMGANQMSMASILLGQQCGVCHGKVAFPVVAATCSKCHSQKKEPAKTASAK